MAKMLNGYQSIELLQPRRCKVGKEKKNMVNLVMILGNVVNDPQVRYTPGSQMAVARFSVALNRGKDKDGNDKGADFPNVVAFGKTAEIVEKYVKKGSKITVQGRIQTGNYTKEDGTKVYTTDVVADRVLLLDKKESSGEETYSGFAQVESDLPF